MKLSVIMGDYHAGAQVALTPLNEGITLDHILCSAKASGFEPTVVIAGSQSEALLKQSRHLPFCDLAFSEPEDDGKLMPQIKAGLTTCNKNSAFINLSLWTNHEFNWNEFKNQLIHLGTISQADILLPENFQTIGWQYFFVSHIGKTFLLNGKQVNDVYDDRLAVHVMQGKTTLACNLEHKAA